MTQRKPDWWLVWLGGFALLLLCVATAYRGDHNTSKLTALIQQKVDARLSSGEFPWLKAVADGQKVILSGAAPSEEARKAAITAVLAADGPGGVVQGGVTKVLADGLTVAGVIAPFVWSAEKTPGGLVLSGHAPSDEIAAQLASAAETVSGGAKVTSSVVAGKGAPAGDWSGLARFGLDQLKLLESGKAELSDTTLTISGAAATMADVAAIEGATRAFSAAPYQVALSLNAPAEWAAKLENGRLVLTGRVPNAQARRALLAAIGKSFKGQIDDQTVLGGEGGWTPAATRLVGDFLKLESGELSYSGKVFRVTGLAGEKARAAIEKAATSLPSGYTAELSLLDAGAAQPAAPAAPTPAPASATDLAGADACDAEFAKVMSKGQILFATNTANISRRSSATLDSIIAEIARCGSMRIEIRGHTDNTGPRGWNMTLSQKRAEAVLAYLVSKGVPAGQLVAVGVGPDKPVASNRRAAGRAQNRRIEFVISRAEDR